MDEIDFYFLDSIKDDNLDKNIEYIFNNLLLELKSYFKLDPINTQVKVSLIEELNKRASEKQNIFSLGVKRSLINGCLKIEILELYMKFLPIILLREAYYCFIPDELKENETLNIIVNQILENNLIKLEIIKEWRVLIDENIVDYDFMASQFDRLEKFLKLQGTEKTESSTIFFFHYIRRNILVIDDKKEDFYDAIFKEFVFKFSKSMKNDEIIETIRVLIKIFYEVKSYRALLDYKKFFKEFKKNGKISTNLSLRKFTENMQWINKSTYIAPSYQINWKAIDIANVQCRLKFNPYLRKNEIDLLIKNLPFFVDSKSSVSNFAIEISGWFIIPKSYLSDLKSFIKRLEDFNYIIDKNCFIYDKLQNNLNLNYFREFYKKGRIINPNHTKYDNKYEITFEINYGQKFLSHEFSLIKFLILDRVKYWSITGFTFEKTTKNLNFLKYDLINEILSQRALINDIKKSLQFIHSSEDLKANLINFLEEYKNYGFFYLKELLENLISAVNLAITILSKNSQIKNSYQFQAFIKKRGIDQSIEENIIINRREIKKIVYHQLISLYFKDKNRFNEKVQEYQIFNDFFTSCFNLKIFSLKVMKKIVDDNKLVEKIYTTKEIKLKELYESYSLKKITSKDFNDILDEFLNKETPILKPILINTINTTYFAKYYIYLILKNDPQILNSLKMLKKFFPRVIIDNATDLFSEEKLIHLQIYLPNLDIKEKEILISILFNLFKDNILSLKRYFYDGFYEAFSRKDFYDFENKDFFYTRDLFEQFFIYIQKIFAKEVKPVLELSSENRDMYWSTEKNLMFLVKNVEERISREQVNFNPINLNKLLEFHKNLEKIILNKNIFKNFKDEEFFKKNIQKISFKPLFQAFGLGEYYLYIRPTNMEKVDLRLLMINTFKKVRYSTDIAQIKSIFIKYIFPRRNPNIAYLNWLTKSKKVVSEYCLFSLKKIYLILHFNYNLTPNGWYLDSNKFKSFMQKVLFNPNFQVNISHIREFNLSALPSANYGPESSYFKDLTQIYSWNSINLKSVLGTRKLSLIEAIKRLVKRKLIIPYIKLKNLELIEKIYIILPEVKPEINEKMVEIFSFFNFGYIYQIECKYFITGFDLEKSSGNGLLIKLYLPNLELSEFKRLFDLLFQYLNVDYIILNDMIDGKNLIKNIFGDLSFLKLYNPLKNLIWNEKDKIWMNHKLFNEKFEPIYPDLI